MHRIGAAEVDITPGQTIEMTGYAGRVQPSTGVHDRLYARALYIEAGEERVMWINCDLLCLENNFAARLKATIAARYDLLTRQVVLSATHTHSGPATILLINAGEVDPEYLEFARERIIEAAAEAVASAAEAEFVSGKGDYHFAIDRRKRASAHVDPRLGVWGWRRPEGDWVALLVNYSMHNTMLNYDNREISGDAAGHAAADLAARLPGRPMVLWTNGGCGNVNPPFKTVDFAKVAEAAGAMAARAAEILATAKPDDAATLAATTGIMQLPLDTHEESRRYTDKYLAELGGGDPKVKAIADFDDPTGYIRNRLVTGAQKWYVRMDEQAAAGTLPRTLPMEIQVVRIGETRFACFAGEIFSRMREELEAASGAPVCVVGYANGYNGYLCTPEAFDEGGYEPDMSFIYGGIPRVSRGAHECARAFALDLIGRVKGKPKAGAAPRRASI